MSRNIRVGLEDQLLATLTEHGPLTTGRLRQITGPHYHNARVAHGRLTPTDPNTQGLPAKHRWETCPDCQCTETREMEGGWATPRVRLALKRLERNGTGRTHQIPGPQQLRRRPKDPPQPRPHPRTDERNRTMSNPDEHMNLVVLAGRVATDPEVRTFDSGAQLLRLMVTVQQKHPTRRVDVVPVTYWDPPQDLVDNPPRKRETVWLTGQLQRRHWESPDGRRSRLELIAHRITVGRTRQLDEPERSMGPEMGL